MNIYEKAKSELIVIGAGTSGTIAAIAAARSGIKTMLVERTGMVGGVGSNALMGSFANLIVNTNKQYLLGGILLELVDRMVKAGATPYQTLREAIFGKIDAPFTIPYQPVHYTKVLLDMLQESGVSLLLNTAFCGGEEQDSSKLLYFTSGGKNFSIETKVLIDATGNAQVAAAFGARMKKMVSSHGCLMRIGQVEIERTYNYIRNTKPWKRDPSYEGWLRKFLKLSETEPITCGQYLLDPFRYDHAPMQQKGNTLLTKERIDYIETRWRKEHILYTLELNLFRYLIKEAAENGDFVINKAFGEKKGVTFNGDGIAYGAWGEGIVLCNVAKPYGFCAEDVMEESRAAIEAFQYNINMYDFLKKYVPGFENAILMDIGSQTVNRVGQTIEGCDCMTGSEDRPIYHQTIYLFGGIYDYQMGIEVPYGKIVPKNCENLFVIGKGSSNGGQYRSQLSCMAMGVAAAAATKVIINTQCTSHTINKGELEQQLRVMGVILNKEENINV